MTDLRRYARQTTFRLVVGFILILLSVGLGLIYIFFDLGGALFGLLCLIAGLAPLGLIFFVLGLIDWIVKRVRAAEEKE